MPGAGLWIIVGLIALLVSLIGQLAVIRLAMEPHFSVGEAIVHGTRRLPVYVAAILIWLVPILIIGSVLYDTLGANEAHPPVAASLALLALANRHFPCRPTNAFIRCYERGADWTNSRIASKLDTLGRQLVASFRISGAVWSGGRVPPSRG